MTERKHSPLPWAPCAANEGKCSCGLIWSADQSIVVARVIRGKMRVRVVWQHDCTIPGTSDEVAQANLEFIVRACNSYYELLRELDLLVSCLETREKVGALNIPGLATLNGARAAIAKARER